VIAKLINTRDNGEAIPLGRLPIVIGRSPEAGIFVNDRFASQHHCEIVERSGSLFVRDLGSSFGCLINGNHVAESPLVSGDRLSVGLTTFVVLYEDVEGERN
jgi:pSer/pThr/pTyr-binding forkhead associated (FHA) protein